MKKIFKKLNDAKEAIAKKFDEAWEKNPEMTAYAIGVGAGAISGIAIGMAIGISNGSVRVAKCVNYYQDILKMIDEHYVCISDGCLTFTPFLDHNVGKSGICIDGRSLYDNPVKEFFETDKATAIGFAEELKGFAEKATN